jgi:CheY-like chemotaxis protein
VSFWTLLDLSTNKENMMDVSKNNLEQAIASLRLSRGSSPACCNLEADVDALIAMLAAQADEVVNDLQRDIALIDAALPDADGIEAMEAWQRIRARIAAPPAAMAEPADNVTPMRQPRADLARLVESINAAVYANGEGLSVTEAIGALELAKLELLKEQEQ